MTQVVADSIDSSDGFAVLCPSGSHHGDGGAAVTDNDEMKTTIRITRGLLRSAKAWAGKHDSSFNGAVIEALSRLTKGDAR